jgi:ribonuclease HII
MDEVGRGALAGPVTVGVVIVSRDCGRPPAGVHDSKLVTAGMREHLRPQIESWVSDYALGHATPHEIDENGIVAAMRLAALRALDGLSTVPEVVLLDGSHDYVSPTRQDPLFGGAVYREVPPITMVVKGDQRCVGIACASIVAKCARDDLMRDVAADYPGYGWARNKGYGSASHLQAIATLGLTEHHRASWRIASLR